MYSNGMIPISADRLDLWHVPVAETVLSGALPEYWNLLSPPERRQEESVRCQQGRNRYRVTRAAIRIVLSRYAAVPPTVWHFCSGPNGRPRLAESSVFALALDFNISHSDDAIAIAVGWGGRVGIDIEPTSRIFNDGLENECLTPWELDAFRALSDKHRRRRFFLETWTLKESYLKARGEGLRLQQLRCFGFDFSTKYVSLHLAGRVHLDRRWCFLQYCPPGGHVGAVCTELRGLRRVALRKLIPLRQESLVPLDILRTSREFAAEVAEANIP
jgi:4'-phosphopantetheinyl transferase